MESGVLTDFALGTYHMSIVAGDQPGRTRVEVIPRWKSGAKPRGG